MKWILSLSLLFLLLVILTFCLPFLIDLNKYQEEYRPVIEQALNRKVTLKDIRLTIWPRIGARVGGFAIEDDPAFRAGSFASLASLDVGVKLMPLFSGKVEVEEITLREPIITVFKNKQGVMNISTLGAAGQKASEPAAPAAPVPEGGPFRALALLAVDRVGITRGSLLYRDESTPTPIEYAVQNLELLLRSVKLGQTPTLHVTATIQPHGLPIMVAAAAGPLVESLDFKTLDIDVTVGKIPLSLKGSAVAGHFHGLLSSPAIHSRDLPIAMPLTKPVVLRDLAVEIDADYPPNRSMPPLRLATMNSLKATVGMGNSSIDLTGSLKDGRLAVNAASKSLNTGDLPAALPLRKPVEITNLAVRASLTDRQATLSQLSLHIFGGELTGQAGFQLGNPAPPFEAKLTLTGLNLGPAVNAFATDKALVGGTASADLILRGVGFAMPELTRALSGTGHVLVRDGRLEGINLTQEVLQAFKVVGLSGDAVKATAFSTVEGDLAIQQGVVHLQRFFADSHDFQAQAAGTIGFDRSLDVKATLTLSDQLSQKLVGASAAARLMVSKGRISVPLTITGTTTDPSYGVDIKAVVGRVGEQLKEKVGDLFRKSPAADKLLEQGGGVLKNLFGQ
jgi:uncharacterized protein involved in outer membrane biogenesis